MKAVIQVRQDEANNWHIWNHELAIVTIRPDKEAAWAEFWDELGYLIREYVSKKNDQLTLDAIILRDKLRELLMSIFTIQEDKKRADTKESIR